MKITYDKEAEAAYIYLTESKVFKTMELNNDVILDLDKKGEIVGVELLNLILPQKSFKHVLDITGKISSEALLGHI